MTEHTKQALLTAYYFDSYSGSMMHVCELGAYLRSKGWRVAVAAAYISPEVRVWVEGQGLELYAADEFPFNTVWDLGLCYHYPILPILLARHVRIRRVLFGSLSAFEELESPSPLLGGGYLTGHSEEWRETLAEQYGLERERLYLLPNLAPDAYFALTPPETGEAPQRIAVVSNHAPAELEDAAQRLRAAGTQVDFLGLGHGAQTPVTPELFQTRGYDCVVTIGKTVQYALAAGIPVYNYDRYGGPGYLTPDNVEQAAAVNFSGRNGRRTLPGSELAYELRAGYPAAATASAALRTYAREHFLLSEKLDALLANPRLGESFESPDAARMLLSRQLALPMKLALDFRQQSLRAAAALSERESELSRQTGELAQQREQYTAQLCEQGERLARQSAELAQKTAAEEALRRETELCGARLREAAARQARQEEALGRTQRLLRRLCEQERDAAQRETALIQALEESRAAQTQTQQRLQESENQQRAVNAAYHALTHAFFWRVTLPVRRLADALKRLLRRREAAAPPAAQPVPAPQEEPASQEEREKLLRSAHRIDVITPGHTLFLAGLIQENLRACGYGCRIWQTPPETYEEIPYIVICPQIVEKLPRVYFAFQMEQTVSSRWFGEEYYRRLENAVAVLDYSLVNIASLQKQLGTAPLYYLPVDYRAAMPAGAEPEGERYDVLFYGDVHNERRQILLEELGREFRVKIISDLFGEELLRELKKARVVVNLHYYEGALLETPRIYEVLSLNAAVVVSERSSDEAEDARLEGVVDFVPVGDAASLCRRVRHWLENEEERAAQVARGRERLLALGDRFGFYFQRVLLAYGLISFDMFYRHQSGYIRFDGRRVCLSLPESVERRRAFDAVNRYGFEFFPGLRSTRGWVGCGMSYKFILRKAAQQGLENVLVCEDDVEFPPDFDRRFETVLAFLESRDDWDVFSGIMADVGDVTIRELAGGEQVDFLYLNHLISSVFNLYAASVYPMVEHWDENCLDVQRNTFDRYLESHDLRVVTTVPFLVGHREELHSTLWGEKNTIYTNLLRRSQEKLLSQAAEFAAGEDTARA